jgi:ABC-type Fe3+-hydroxamate transport system substrate-binding protein
MQKAVIYGIIAAAIVAAGVGIAFVAVPGMSNTPITANQQSDINNEVRVIEHAAGETEVMGTPERVVVFSNNDYVEDVLALGVQPVGVAQLDSMRQQLVELPVSLSPDVADVGTDDEPNLEAVAQLEPDLIVGRLDVNGGIYEDLSSIAPTILFEHISVEGGPSRLEVQRQNFMALADALNKQEKGEEVLEMQQARYDELAAEIEAAGLTGTRFILVETFFNNPDMFQVYDSNFPAVEILESVGLESAVTSEDGALLNQEFIDQTSFSPWGISNVGLEAVTTFDGSDVHFIHGARHGPRGADVIRPYYSSNPVWQNLEFVKAGHVHNIGNVWMTGGIYTTTAVVERVVDALTGGQQSTGETRTVKHALGETTITGTPERVVALYSVQVGNVRALGVMPVGVADLDFQNELLSPVGLQLSKDVVHVGTPSEPNFETLLQLEPDLIVGGAFQAEIYDELSEIAPTILFAEEPTEELNELEVAEQNFMAIADALNRHDEGVAYLERLDSLYAEATAKIDQSGLAGTEFVLIESWLQNGAPHMYVTKENGMFSLVLNQTGLKSAVPADYVLEPGYENAGWYQTSMEGLSTLDGPDVRILNSHGGENPLESSPLWDNLEFAQNGHVYSVGEIRTDQFAYTEMLVNRVVEALTGNQSETRTISHAMGEITITGTPQRVVTLYSVFTGDVRALGVQPAATADKDWINGWLTPLGLPLSEEVVDVGIPDEPNLEVIAQLEPDLIIGHGGVWGVHDEIYDDLNDIAPTMILDDGFSEEGLDELELGKSNFMKIANALNRHDAGVAFLENIESQYDEAAAKIEQAGMAGSKFVFVQAYLSGDTPGAYVFTENSFSTKVMNNIGLVNNLTDPTDTTDKWFETGMEGITTLDTPGTHLIVTYNAGQYEGNPLATSPLWDDLGFVKEGRVHDIGNTRVFGQVIFIEEIVSRVVDSFTSGNGTQVVNHAMGETEITDSSPRIAALSWQSGSDLLTFGVEPVGIVNADTFSEIVNLNQVALPSDMAGVGLYEPGPLAAETLANAVVELLTRDGS